jgi:hypothetical protein
VEIPKYAKLENERRFLVRDCPDLSEDPGRLIEDLYLDAGRLRLRAITHPGGEREFKFCKKYQSADPASGPIVNIYLTAEEYDGLAALPGRRLRKRRHRVAWRERAFGVDVFEGALVGLILCEAEASSAEAIRALAFPPWAGREVTADLFFTGGNLARIDAATLKRRL